MNEEALFASVLSIAEDTSDPRLMRLEFIFTDFSPNSNGMSVPVEEAENIIRSATDMPILINFKGGPQGHSGAIPIGPIKKTYIQDDKIIGEAFIWKKQYPEIAEWISTAHASGETVQFSWELYHNKLKSYVKDGITYLRDIVVKGITIVDNPAYSGRTPLLSFAEEDRVTQLEITVKNLSEKLEGFFRSEETMPELETVAEATNETVVEQPAVNEELQRELEELRQFKSAVEAEKQKANRISTRKAKMAELGVSDDAWFSSREDFIAGLDDGVFAEYADDLAHFAKKTPTTVVTSEKNDKTEDNSGSFVPEPHTSTRTVNTDVDVAALGKALRKKN